MSCVKYKGDLKGEYGVVERLRLDYGGWIGCGCVGMSGFKGVGGEVELS